MRHVANVVFTLPPNYEDFYITRANFFEWVCMYVPRIAVDTKLAMQLQISNLVIQATHFSTIIIDMKENPVRAVQTLELI